jgi:hypothetical protein
MGAGWRPTSIFGRVAAHVSLGKIEDQPTSAYIGKF